MSLVNTDRTAAATEVATRMAEAATAWLAALDPGQRAVATRPAPGAGAESQAERQRWFYTPTDHGGLPPGAPNAGPPPRAWTLPSRAAAPPPSPLRGREPLPPLAGAEDLARELMRSLGPDAEALATLHSRAPSDIVGGNRPRLADGDEMIRLRHIWNGDFTDPDVVETLLAADNRNEEASGYEAADHRRLALTAQPRGLAARD